MPSTSPFNLVHLEWAITTHYARRTGEAQLWARTEPACAEITDIADVIAGCAEPGTGPALAAALVRLAVTRPAARMAVLAAAIGGLTAVSGRWARHGFNGGPWTDRNELEAELVSAAIEQLNRLTHSGVDDPMRSIHSHARGRLHSLAATRRRRARRIGYVTALHLLDDDEHPATGDDPADGGNRSGPELAAAVLVDLDRRGLLSRHDTAVVYRSAVDGLTPHEIADSTGASYDAVRKARGRALTALRVHLRPAS
jgi:DNA-directed RNA polymerase specialized sigma24 family protein